MAFKWKPSKAKAKEFAQSMNNDPAFREEYEARKEKKAAARRATSAHSYATAGGRYVPTEYQRRAAFHYLSTGDITDVQKNACNIIIESFDLNEKCHHDFIHEVNELIRNGAWR